MKDIKETYKSESCKEIIATLQKLKQDKRNHFDKCKIDLMVSKENLELAGRRLHKKVCVLSEFDPYARPAKCKKYAESSGGKQDDDQCSQKSDESKRSKDSKRDKYETKYPLER